MTTLRVGVIGAGVMGRGHAEFIRDHISEARVVAVSDVDSERVHGLADDLGADVTTFSSADDLINSGLVDALIIASPDALHVSQLRSALDAGLPTLCEKPIATTLSDAGMIASEIKAAEELRGGRLVSFGFMRRFDHAYLQVKKAIESEEYGKVLFVRTSTRNVSSPGITSEGLYTNIAVHDFDIWRWMLSDEWASVSSHHPRSSGNAPEGLKDPLIFVAKMKSGILVVGDVIANDYYGYDLRTEVVCERGSLEIGIFGDVHTRSNFVAEPVQGGQMVQNWIPRSREAYIQELKAWVISVNSGVTHPDLASVDDAFAATSACFLAIDSL
jgi:myo-inositol 2-dehydrogenase/D-chiro-inositol 1-dehydrogenase